MPTSLSPGTRVVAAIDIRVVDNIHVRPDASASSVNVSIDRGTSGEILEENFEEIRVRFYDSYGTRDDIWIARTVVGNYLDDG